MNIPTALQTEFVFEARVNCDPMILIGASKDGKRQLIPIAGGEFSGSTMKGRVLSGGADWQLIRPDGVTEIVARYTIQTDEGVNIAVVNRGIAVYPPDFAAKRARGETIDPNSVYVRTTPAFEAPNDSVHAWLNKSVFVGTVRPISLQPLVVSVAVFRVL